MFILRSSILPPLKNIQEAAVESGVGGESSMATLSTTTFSSSAAGGEVGTRSGTTTDNKAATNYNHRGSTIKLASNERDIGLLKEKSQKDILESIWSQRQEYNICKATFTEKKIQLQELEANLNYLLKEDDIRVKRETGLAAIEEKERECEEVENELCPF